MPKKRFSELSRSQKYRRLKHIQISEIFVPENINNQNVGNSLLDQNIFNYVSEFVFDNNDLDQNMSHHEFEFVLHNNICNNFFENMATNAAIDQSIHISTICTSTREP